VKRWLFITALPLAVAAGLALSVALAGSPFGSDGAATEREGVGEAMPVPREDGAPPPADTVVGDGAAGTEPAPDDPVVSGPVTSIDGIPENECNLVHNIDACERIAVDAAKADLAGRLEIAPDDIDVSVIESTYWDGCLGVETPGMACIQIAIPGYRIVLTADGIAYEYHTDTTGNVALVP
jgi:hypothetical protein